MNKCKKAVLVIWLCGLTACGSSKPATKQAEMPAVSVEPVASVPAPTEAPMPSAEEKPPVAAPVAVDPKAESVKAELVAFELAKPVFVAHCARCHVKGEPKATAKKLGHFDMTAYPFTGHHAATIGDEVDEVLGQAGKAATMPIDKRGAVKGDDLAKIMAWSAAWRATEKLGGH